MIRLQNVLKMSSGRICETCLEDALKTSWRHLGKTSLRCLEDIWTRRIYWSWPRRLGDVFWRHMINKNIFIFIKMSRRRLHQDECLLGCDNDHQINLDFVLQFLHRNEKRKTNCISLYMLFMKMKNEWRY